MLFQKTQMCFNEPDYVMAHYHGHNDSKPCQHGTKNATLIFLSYYCLSLVGKGSLQAHNDKCLLFFPT